MCYNIAYIERRIEKYKARYKEVVNVWDDPMEEKEETNAQYFISGFTHPKLPVIRLDGIQFQYWGLIPSWAKDETVAKDIRTKTLNAVGETAFEKPSFKSSIRNKRGILGVSGFYEWRHVGTQKYPYFIRAKDEEYTSVGVIFNEWLNKATGEMLPSFSIVTTAANPMMEMIHNSKKRMPLILNKESEKEWVDPDLPEDHVRRLIRPFESEKMEAYTVSQMVNSARNNRNVPEAMAEVEYPELQLLSM